MQTKSKNVGFLFPECMVDFHINYLKKNDNPLLVTKSWCRIAGDSGQKHEISIEGCNLVEEGFV